jgi:hypothetical protein
MLVEALPQKLAHAIRFRPDLKLERALRRGEVISKRGECITDFVNEQSIRTHLACRYIYALGILFRGHSAPFRPRGSAGGMVSLINYDSDRSLLLAGVLSRQNLI